jgi:hypothetical protein
LLADIRRLFDDQGAERLRSSELAQRLAALEDSPWGDLRGKSLDPPALARRLKPYGIKPKKLRFDGTVLQGYEREGFQDSWKRYLAGDVASSRNSRNIGSTTPNATTPPTGTQPEMFQSEYGQKPLNQADVPDVPVTRQVQDAPASTDCTANADDIAAKPLATHIPTASTQAGCRYPSHRSSDWQTPDGRRICGICHPRLPPR